MKQFLAYIFLFFLAASCSTPPKDAAPQWVALFNGKDLNAWIPKIKGYALGENFGNTFRVEDGLMKVRYDTYDSFDNRFGHIFYKKPFANYRLRIEYRFVGQQAPNGPGWAFKNSGVMLHGQTAESMTKDQDFPISIEVQFLGGNGEEKRPTANLCTPGTDVMMNGTWLRQHCINSTSPTFHHNEWVSIEVLVLQDSLIEHFVNGEKVMSYRKPQIQGGVVNDFDGKIKEDGFPLMSGTISLQSESHPIDFRKVEIMELPLKEKKPQVEAIAFTGKRLFPIAESLTIQHKKDSLLQIAAQNYASNPADLDNIVWYGRRTAYLSHYQKAIEIYTKGLAKFPNSAELYRHRGHRYISTRQLDKAIADFEKAADLAKDRPIEIEPDGIPNKLNHPLSSLQFNIYYHWALAYYLKGNFEKAADLYEKCMEYSTNPDLLTATTDWLYMAYKRMGEATKANALLKNITSDIEIIENTSYFNRLLMYKGLKKPEDLVDFNQASFDNQLDVVTQAYGLGNWYFYNREIEKAKAIFEKILATDHWSAFGYIAAEAEISRY